MMPVAADVRSPAEIPTTQMWRDTMRRARKAHGLSQGQLALKVGGSQPLISGIESGTIAQSGVVLAICEVLAIQPPSVMVEDEADQRWIEAGRMLRAKAPELFEGQLVGAEAIVKAVRGSDDE